MSFDGSDSAKGPWGDLLRAALELQLHTPRFHRRIRLSHLSRKTAVAIGIGGSRTKQYELIKKRKCQHNRTSPSPSEILTGTFQLDSGTSNPPAMQLVCVH